ncbi:MAG: hypothetical protein ABI389_04915 [Rhodanobacter sp.]
MRELESLLPDLVPPVGGLTRLQRSVQAGQRMRYPRRPAWWSLAAGTCALALLTLTWLPGFVAQHQRTAKLTRALMQSIAPALPADGIRVINGAALALPSAQANVRIYLVQSNPQSPQRTP